MIFPLEPKTKRITTNPNTNIENKEEDRLSDLPDSILHHILSLLDTKQAFQTSILSTRWKNLPNHLPTLRLSSTGFNSFDCFIKSLTQILSLRDDSTALHSLDFYRPQDFVDPKILESMVNYAISHNVQLLRISVSCDIQQLQSSLFSSQTLTSLDLSIHYYIHHWKILFPSSLNLPALTTLTLTGFYFRSDNNGCTEPFSSLNKLNTLIIGNLRFLKGQSLCISSTTLVNLTIYGYYLYNKYKSKIMLSAPFVESVSRILSLRDDLTSLQTLDLYHCPRDFDFVCPDILKSIVYYTVTYNVQRVRVCVTCNIQQLPSCLFSSQTLTSLDLSIHHRILPAKLLFPSSLNLPALTTLTLISFYFLSGDDGCAEPFSTLNKLNTLIIRHCKVVDAQTLCISSTTLVNFTMVGYNYYYYYKEIHKLELSTPRLSMFAFTGTPDLKLCVSHPCSITHLCIHAEDIIGFVKEDSAVLLISWLQELANIKSLTVSSNTLQVLSFVPDLFNVKLTSLCNLESLQVEMKLLTPGLYVLLSHRKYKETGSRIHLTKDKLIPVGVVEFLLQTSPLAKVNFINNDD
ncbi:putative F-box domain, leucine-rich repeat domain, L domain-containing protein [Medicago truncatula]|uniref:Putative F-box domain, leucine-rich repeat domain, L domain-containing protein n=1 Tax=Medicago truncatula TaxID=3880 RepID=A0A396IJR9_MEDTR|nr:putative F-box domain, leucine-rich repeat domain, L domain-containing protein [Medicago truncatula]